MLKLGASSGEELTYFTFWDMDDTCINTHNDTVKNPHLLLPIMLYQTTRFNQRFGICTNRAATELEGCYPVPSFIEDLARYGIKISQENVLYGGGENNRQFSDDYHKLQLLMQGLSEQLKAIELTETAEHIKVGLTKIKELCLADERSASHEDSHMDVVSFLGTQIERAGYYGKNFHINQFLRSKYDSQTESFLFDGHRCSKKHLVFGMVDDKVEIAGDDIIAPLGLSQFFGVKASRGGKPPRDSATTGDYYRDDYLFKLGVHIGLMDLSKRLLSSLDKADTPMLAMAVLLFAWHAFPEECSLEKHIEPCLKALRPVECQQIVAMLDYIRNHANTHADAHYHPVDEIFGCAQKIDHTHFLESAFERVAHIREEIEIERQTFALKKLTISSSESNLFQAQEQAKEKKSKFKFSLKKTASARSKSAMTTDEEMPVILVSDRQAALEKEEAMICARVASLRKFPEKSIARRARHLHKKLEPSAWVPSASYSTKESVSTVASEEDTSSSESSPTLFTNRTGRPRGSRLVLPKFTDSPSSSQASSSRASSNSTDEDSKSSHSVVIGRKSKQTSHHHKK